MDRMLGDARQNVGEPGLRIDVVHLGCDDQVVHQRGTLAAAIRPAEQPRLPTQSDAAHTTLCRIVGQADAAVIEEAGERTPALEHVVHGLGHIVVARELGALLTHPSLQIGHERRAEILANRLASFGALTVDHPLDLEQGIDPAHHFQRQRRDHRRLFALSLATGVLGQIRHHEIVRQLSFRAPEIDLKGERVQLNCDCRSMASAARGPRTIFAAPVTLSHCLTTNLRVGRSNRSGRASISWGPQRLERRTLSATAVNTRAVHRTSQTNLKQRYPLTF